MIGYEHAVPNQNSRFLIWKYKKKEFNNRNSNKSYKQTYT